MSEYEIGKDIQGLAARVEALETALRDILDTRQSRDSSATPNAPPKCRPVQKEGGLHWIDPYEGLDVGANEDGTYTWSETFDPTPEKDISTKELCDIPLRETGAGGGAHRAMCHIKVNSPGAFGPKVSSGSGALISRRCVLTAAHVVYDDGKYAASVEVSPRRHPRSNPYGTHSSSLFRVLAPWREHRDSNFDLGVVVLPDDTCFNRVNYYMGVKQYSHDRYAEYYVTGYPGGGEGINVGNQYHSWGTISEYDDHRLYYRMSSLPGMSGGPIHNQFHDPAFVVGVHNGGSCPNHAKRIDLATLRIIHDWIDQYG